MLPNQKSAWFNISVVTTMQKQKFAHPEDKLKENPDTIHRYYFKLNTAKL